MHKGGVGLRENMGVPSTAVGGNAEGNRLLSRENRRPDSFFLTPFDVFIKQRASLIAKTWHRVGSECRRLRKVRRYKIVI